jgi:hypothetical protein
MSTKGGHSGACRVPRSGQVVAARWSFVTLEQNGEPCSGLRDLLAEASLE